MDYMDRGLSPRNIYPGLAAQGCYDTQGRLAGYYHGEEQMPQSEEKEEEAPTTTEEHQASETVDQIPRTEYPVATARENAQGRFDNNRQAQQSQSRQTQVASTISQNTQQQRGGMPSQNSRIKHPNPAAHGYNGGQRRWNGYSIEDERALQPQSLMAVGPSTANELMLPRYGGMQPQYPAMSATSSSGISRLVPQANAPNVYRQSLLRTNLDGQYSPPSQPEPATAANQTTQQQRGSKPSQKSATQTSDVLFPVLHAPETMMALHSGLPISVALSDLCHNAYPVDGQDPRYSIEYFGKCQDPYPLLDPELMATHPSGTALHLDNSSAAGKVDRQQHDLIALPQKQHQQYQQQQYGSGPDTNALGVYSQGMQHLHPSPSDPFDAAASQRDGSEALPLQQHESKPDMNTPGVYDQGMQQGSLYGQHQSPHPSSSDQWADSQGCDSQVPSWQQQQISAPGVNASAAYGRDSLPYNVPNQGYPHLSPPDSLLAAALEGDCSQAPPWQQQQTSGLDANASTAYGQEPLPYGDPDKGNPLLSSLDDPSNPSIDPSIYHIAGDRPILNNITLNNATFHAPLSGPYNSIFTQNVGQQHQHQPPLRAPQQANPPHQPNNAFNPNQPYAFDYNLPYDDVYKNLNNQTQLASYATKTQIPPTTTPATTPAPPTRALGDKVGEPIPLDLTVLVAGLLALPHVDASRKHPHRSDLKKPWKNPVVYSTATQSQQDIRDNFDSGSGYIKRASALLDWYGDVSVFSMAFWDFLVRGEPRANKKRGNQGEGERQDSEEGCGAKKQKKRQKRQKREDGDAAEAGVAGGDVGGAYVGGAYVGGQEVGEENVAVEDIAENVVAEKDVGGERVPEGEGEMGSIAPKRQSVVTTERSSVCEDIVRGYTPEGETREQKASRYRDQLKAADARRMADSMDQQGYNVQHLSANPEEGQAGPGSGVGAGSSDTDAPFLSGLPCNEFGELLKDSGDIAGELVAGDATKLSKSDLTADAKGRFINGKGKTVGRSKAFPQVEGEKKVEQEENDDAPLSILIGLPCTKAGKLIDLNGKIVGVLFEGDAESIAESGITASPGGQFWGDKGVLLGRARTVG